MFLGDDCGSGLCSLGSLSLGSLSLGSLSLGSLCLGCLSLGCLGLGCLSLGCLCLGCLSLGCLSLGSLSLGSLCLGSLCLGSLCLGSLCLGSLCLGSLCLGSLCLGCLSLSGDYGISGLAGIIKCLDTLELIIKDLALIDDSCEFLVSQSYGLECGLDLGSAGSSYLIVGYDQLACILIEHERVSDVRCRSVEVQDAGLSSVSHCGFLGYREHGVQIGNSAFCVVSVCQSNYCVCVSLVTTDGTDLTAVDVFSVHYCVNSELVAHIILSCFYNSAVDIIDHYCCFS